MQVKINETFSGLHGAFKKGSTVEMREDVAKVYLKCGYVSEAEAPKEEASLEVQPPKKLKMNKAKAPNVEGI